MEWWKRHVWLLYALMAVTGIAMAVLYPSDHLIDLAIAGFAASVAAQLRFERLRRWKWISAVAVILAAWWWVQKNHVGAVYRLWSGALEFALNVITLIIAGVMLLVIALSDTTELWVHLREQTPNSPIEEGGSNR